MLFCLLGGTPDELSPAELGLAALVSAVGGGTPGRVVGWWPQAGRLMVTAVDASLLLDTADHVVRAVAATRLVRSAASGTVADTASSRWTSARSSSQVAASASVNVLVVS